MSDWAKTLLADVARQVDDEVPDGDSTVDVVQLVHSVLERRLLGLLEAGTAMQHSLRSYAYYGNASPDLANEAIQFFEKAKAAAMKEPG